MKTISNNSLIIDNGNTLTVTTGQSILSGGVAVSGIATIDGYRINPYGALIDQALIYDGTAFVPGSVSADAYYQLIQSNGISLPQEDIFNFGPSFLITNDSVNTRTTIDLTSTGIAPGTYQGITFDAYGRATSATNESYALDGYVVHVSGAENITGSKTFNSTILANNGIDTSTPMSLNIGAVTATGGTIGNGGTTGSFNWGVNGAILYSQNGNNSVNISNANGTLITGTTTINGNTFILQNLDTFGPSSLSLGQSNAIDVRIAQLDILTHIYGSLQSDQLATFKNHISVDGYTIDLSSGSNSGQILSYNGTSFVPSNAISVNISTASPITGGTITSTGTIGITKSSSTTDGYLSSFDWNTFNNKQPAGSYVVLSPGVQQTGSINVSSTIEGDGGFISQSLTNSGDLLVQAGTSGNTLNLRAPSGTINVGAVSANSIVIGNAASTTSLDGYINTDINWSYTQLPAFRAIRGAQSPNNASGVGGQVWFLGGQGWNSDGTAAATSGGQVAIKGGNGGNASGSFAAGSGASTTNLFGGDGGAGSSAAIAGAGGAANLQGGAGGLDNGAGGGDGGGVTINGGAGANGTVTGVSGTGGSVIISAGPTGIANGGGTHNQNAAAVSLAGATGIAANGPTVGQNGGLVSIGSGTGGAGGSASASAGSGGAVNIVTGNGGAASSASVGGVGGTAKLQAGNGGAGSPTQKAGAGGQLSLLSGGGGADGGGGGAAGGLILIQSGGGSSVLSTIGGGAGGQISLRAGKGSDGYGTIGGFIGGSIVSGSLDVNTAGKGGAATTLAAAGGGGIINLSAGTGGDGATTTNKGGTGGGSILQGGNGGLDNGAGGGTGGSATLRGGIGANSAGIVAAGAGGSATVIGGAGGNANAAGGAANTGGQALVTGGAAGTQTALGANFATTASGTGGPITLTGGAGSASVAWTGTTLVCNVGNLSRSGSTVTATISGHGLTVGSSYRASMYPGETNFPAGIFTITIVDANTFTYTQSGSAVSSASTENFAGVFASTAGGAITLNAGSAGANTVAWGGGAAGGGINITSGNGSAGDGYNLSGAGGNIALTAGTAGANGGGGASTSGGNITGTAGTAPAALSSGTVQTAGTAGFVVWTGGIGGAGSSTVAAGAGGLSRNIGGAGGASGGGGAGGTGGAGEIRGGAGGAGSGSSAGGGGGGANAVAGGGGAGTASAAGGAGGAVQILAGTAGTNNGVTSGLGGGVTISAGGGAAANGSAAGSASGNVTINVGATGAASTNASGGAAGTIIITSGAGAAAGASGGTNPAATAGGALTASGGTGGAANATGTGAAAIGGAGTFSGGQGGAGAAGNTAGAAGGQAFVNGGNGGAGSGSGNPGTGGQTTIAGGTGGTGGSGNSNGGAVSIQGGAAQGSGTNGAINIGTTRGAITMGVAATPITMAATTTNFPANAVFGASAGSATNTTAMQFNPNVADGASSVAFDINNQTTLSTSGALLLRVRNNGTNEFTLDRNGNPSFTGSITNNGGTNAFTASNFSGAVSLAANGVLQTTAQATTNTTSIQVNPNVADGASSIAFDINNQTTLSTSGALVFSVRNNGTSMFKVDKLGTATFAGGGNFGGQVTTTNIDRATTGAAVLFTTTATSLTIGGANINSSGIIVNSGGGTFQLNYNGASSGAQKWFYINSTNQTNQTASTEINGVLCDLSATRTWSTGAIALQREFRIKPPTYAFNAASTITQAATFSVDGYPVAGTNATITESVPLLINNNGVGATTAINTSGGILLQNTTAAALGAQQYSPMLVLDGQGWNTTSSASQDMRFGMQVLPGQGTSVTGSLAIYASVNNASYGSAIFTLTNNGTLFLSNTLSGQAVWGTSFDQKTAGALPIGNTNATSISLGRNNTAFSGYSIFLGSGAFNMSSATRTSGNASYLQLTTSNDTGQTASTEVNSVNYILTGTRTWNAGAIALQREFRIQNPTYAFSSASTITQAATVAIDGPPIAGSNATLTSSYPLLINNNGIGTSHSFNSYGLSIQNTTAATSGNQQNSPILELVGDGYDTGAGASKTTAWGMQVVPVQGSPTQSQLWFMNSTGGATYSSGAVVFSSAGTVQAAKFTTANTGGPLPIVGNQTNGASAVSVSIDTTSTYSTAGAKLLSVRNNGTEKAYFDYNGSLAATHIDGYVGAANPTATAKNANVSTVTFNSRANDVDGYFVMVATGTIAGDASWFTLNFATAYANAPIVHIFAYNIMAASATQQWYADSVTTTGFNVENGGNLNAGTYWIGYHVFGN